MLAASPIMHVHAVQAPVMMFLGAADRRVPHIDGLAYRAALRCAPLTSHCHLCKHLHLTVPNLTPFYLLIWTVSVPQASCR
jgi:hypothetical protein